MPPTEAVVEVPPETPGVALGDKKAFEVLDFLTTRAGCFTSYSLAPCGSGLECFTFRLNDRDGNSYALRYADKGFNAKNWMPLVLFYGTRPDDILYALFNSRSDITVQAYGGVVMYFLKAGETLDEVLAQAEIEKDLRVNKP